MRAGMTTSKPSNFDQSQAGDLSEQVRLLQNDIHSNRPGDASAAPLLAEAWSPVIDSLDLFSADFMETRNQPEQQIREILFP
jgi:hypothetical protein